MQVGAYLERIRYAGSRAPTAETLREVHRAHLLAVPFENLDIHLGTPIVLSAPAFYDKIVKRRRGGFCYELNGLLAWLLEGLGFRVTLLSGRVFGQGGLSPEFDHLLLLVELDERWIADVGFGDSFLEPFRLDAGGEVEQQGRRYALVKEDEGWVLRRSLPDAPAEPQFSFTLTPRRLEEFAPRCVYQQTSPESHFTQKSVCSLATGSGRVTLSNGRIIHTEGKWREEREVRSVEEYRAILRREFGIHLGEEAVERLMRPQGAGYPAPGENHLAGGPAASGAS